MSKLDLFHDEIVNDYLNEGLGMRNLESKYGINRKYLSSHFKKHNVPIKKHGFIAPHIQEKLDNKEWMVDAYGKTKSYQGIADSLGITKQCVGKYIKKHNITVDNTNWNDNKELISVDDVMYESEFHYKSLVDYKHVPTHVNLKNRDWLLNLYKEYMNIGIISRLINVSYPTVQNALHYHNIPIVKSGNTSLNERRLIDVLSEFNPVQSYKLDGIELDIYFPEHNVAVEINGYKFHSELAGSKGRQYHQSKYEVCKKHGIHLYQFWDEEVNQKFNLIINMIKAKCGVSTAIHGRKTVVREVDNCNEFLNENHVQGSCNYSYAYGLFYEDELVAVMTFIKSRNHQYDYELNRFCVKQGYRVVGGFSKLLKHTPEGVLVSYSDCRYSDGNVYKQNGFRLTRINDPIYYYTKDYKSIESRMKYQKSRIAVKHPQLFDINKTEWEMMQELKYDRIWSCKTYTWVLK